MAAGELTETGRTEQFEFTARRWPFFGLLLVNLILTILTLGFYRFWAKTKVRKFIWSNVRFMGDPLEYTGKPSELLLGFLIVIAILFPLGLIYNAISFLVPPEQFWLRIVLELVYYLVLFALIQIGFYRAWRYRMSRTAWRGIRLGLDGSTFSYLKISVGWTALSFITFGLAYPWQSVELWRYQITHTRIGQTAAKFKGSGRGLFGSWLVVLIPTIVGLAGLVAIPVLYGDYLDTTNWSLPELRETGLFALVTLSGIAFATAVFTGFWFNIKLTRYQISGVSLLNTTVNSQLPVGRLLGFAFLSIFILVLMASAVAVVVELTVVGPDLTFADMNPSFFSPILMVLFTFIVFPLAWAVIYKFELIKQVFITATITNPEALEGVVQSAAESQKTGEGLADALDIGGL